MKQAQLIHISRVNNKGAGQTARTYMPVCAFVEERLDSPFNPYPASNFVLKVSSAFRLLLYSSALQTVFFIMEANTMDPDQTAPKGAF